MNKHITTLILCLSSISLFAQEVPTFKKTSYRDSLNNLYWNKEKPVFIMLSESPDGTNAEKLESKCSKEYTEPFYFDSEGINYIRTNWAVNKETKQLILPKQQIKWEVYADGCAPTSKLKLKSKFKHVLNKQLYASNINLSIKSYDKTSGVKSIYYSVNGQPYTQYTSPFSLKKEDNYNIQYFAVDNVGNREEIKHKNIQLDITPPTSKCTISGLSIGDENIISQTTKIYIEAHDSLSGVKHIYYRIDSMPKRIYTPKTNINIAYLNDGHHKIHYYSTDNVGNNEKEQVFVFYLDKTAPITVSDILGDKFIVNDKIYFSGRTKMKITSVDNKSGVKEVLYSLDNGKFQPYTTPFYMPNSPGWHIVKYFATDNTSNITKSEETNQYPEYKMKIDKIYVDLTGPTIKANIHGDKYVRNDTVYIGPNSKIQASGIDKESGLKQINYSIDGALKETSYNKPFTLADYSTGEHTIEFFGYDNVNNRNIDKIKVILDNSGPEIKYTFSVRPLTQTISKVNIYPQETDLFISAQDDITGIKSIFYTLNKSEKKPYGGYISNFQKGTNIIVIEVYDKLKNKSTLTLKFKIK